MLWFSDENHPGQPRGGAVCYGIAQLGWVGQLLPKWRAVERDLQPHRALWAQAEGLLLVVLNCLSPPPLKIPLPQFPTKLLSLFPLALSSFPSH